MGLGWGHHEIKISEVARKGWLLQQLVCVRVREGGAYSLSISTFVKFSTTDHVFLLKTAEHRSLPYYLEEPPTFRSSDVFCHDFLQEPFLPALLSPSRGPLVATVFRRLFPPVGEVQGTSSKLLVGLFWLV